MFSRTARSTRGIQPRCLIPAPIPPASTSCRRPDCPPVPTMERDNRRDRKDDAMRIAIIGAGNVGGTLGKMWAAKGHEVAFGVRSPNDGG
jgi:F420-dependent NADP oxidoreductase-like protein